MLERLSLTIDSDRTFADTGPEVEQNRDHIKTVTSVKSQRKHPNQSLISWRQLESQKHE